MSVINNVLRGLETRESQFTPIEILSIEPGKSVERTQNPLLIGGLALLALFVAGGYYWQNQPDFSVVQLSPKSDETEQTQAAIAPLPLVAATPLSANEITPAQQTIEQPVALDVAVADAPPLPGNQIVGLQIREGETEMRLEFVLRERAAAYLKERGENSFSYHLRNIENQIVAPLIHHNRWIRQLTILPIEGGVDVNFATAPDILVETRQSEQDGESVWAIYLREAKPAAPVIAAQVETSQPVALQARPVVNTPAVQAEPEPVVTLKIKATNPVTQTTNQLDYALQLMNSSRSGEAEKLLRSLFGGTHDYSARKHLLALYSRLNRATRLRSLLQYSVLEYPQDSFFTTEYARSLFAATAYREVIEFLGAADGLDADKQALLAASYQRLDEHEAAIRHYQLALQQDAQNARNWVGLGISRDQNAEFAEALDAYQEASRLGGLNARLQAFVQRRSDNLRQVLN